MKNVASFLDEMSVKFQTDFAVFDVYQFLGTGTELLARLATWTRPTSTALQHIDIGELTLEAPNAAAARSGIEDSLQRTAEIEGRLLVTMNGIHLLASLYPGALLQPVNQWLRRGSRVVVLAVPPSNSLRFPESAFTADWRSALANQLGLDHTITLGGVQL